MAEKLKDLFTRPVIKRSSSDIGDDILAPQFQVRPSSTERSGSIVLPGQLSDDSKPYHTNNPAFKSEPDYESDYDPFDDDDGIVTPEWPGTPESPGTPPLPATPLITFDHHIMDEQSRLAPPPLDGSSERAGSEQGSALKQALHELSPKASDHNKAEITPPRLSTPEPETDAEEDRLLDELRQLLEAEAAESDSGDKNETYEQRRQRKLRTNESLLAQLGLGGGAASMLELPQPKSSETEARTIEEQAQSSQADISDANAPEANETKRYRWTKHQRKLKLAEDGTTVSLPPPGVRLAVAYVNLPLLRDRARNDYIFVPDVSEPVYEDPWSEPEEEPLEEDEEAEADDESFPGIGRKGKRGRKLKPKVEKTPVKRTTKLVPDDGWTSCHQCRRKTPDDKMQCCRRSGEFACTLMYCGRCIRIRYGMDFAPDSTTFECPRCKGYCNCSICLRKSGLSSILDSEGKKRATTLTQRMKDENGNPLYKSVKEYVQAILGKTQSTQRSLLPKSARKVKSSRGTAPAKSSASGVAQESGGNGQEPASRKRKASVEAEAQGGSAVDSDIRDRKRRSPYTVAEPLVESVLADRSTQRRFKITLLPSGGHQVTALASAIASETAAESTDQTDTADESSDALAPSNARRVSATVIPERAAKLLAESKSNVWVKGAADVSSPESSDLSDMEDKEPSGDRQTADDQASKATEWTEPDQSYSNEGGKDRVSSILSEPSDDLESEAESALPPDTYGDEVGGLSNFQENAKHLSTGAVEHDEGDKDADSFGTEAVEPPSTSITSAEAGQVEAFPSSLPAAEEPGLGAPSVRAESGLFALQALQAASFM